MPVHSIRPTKKTDAVCHSVNPDPSEQADAVCMSVAKAPVPKAVRPRKTAADVKRSHHRKLKCPLCTTEVFDLKRHLRSHVKKDGLPEHKINQVYSVAVVQNKQRGPPRKSNDGSRAGLPYKWCPFKGCDIATHRLKSHLTHFHHLRPGALLDGYLKVAKIYHGKKEKRKLADLLHASSDSDDSSSPPAPKVLATATSTQATTTLRPPPAIPPTTSETETTAGSDDDEEFQDRVLQEDFFTCPTPSSKRHQWLVAFHKFLNLPDAGHKKDRNRLQHASHIRTILEDLDPSKTNIEVLSQDKGYIVWTDWVDPKMSTLKSGTINAYLGTLQKFLTFVTEERVRSSSLPTLSADCLRILRNTIPKLAGW